MPKPYPKEFRDDVVRSPPAKDVAVSSERSADVSGTEADERQSIDKNSIPVDLD
ncbi:hypothetical protein ACFV24_27025 [Nocardia fluminea]|uniref:hypothetical protein n=1 Tax=Nocardia fluminea TaxID=134984 RepID=UPI00366FB851